MLKQKAPTLIDRREELVLTVVVLLVPLLTGAFFVY